jgi:hypothetical protein
MAMRATYVPDPAATMGVARMVVTTRATATDGELTLYFVDHRRVRMALTAEQLRALLRRWAAAARAGQGELLIAD